MKIHPVDTSPEAAVTDSNRLLAAALYYAQRGWPTFPLGRTKRPVANCPACRASEPGHDPAACGCLSCHGFHAATTDPGRIAAMRSAHPRGLLAIRTGVVSSLLVVDIDPRNGGLLVPELMPPTATVRTGNAGWHLYYRHPGPHVPSRGLHGYPGVDIKADGGYVAAPPSIHPDTGQPYRWVGDRSVGEMPPALLAACLATESVSSSSTSKARTTASSEAPCTRLASHIAGGGGISSPTALLAANIDAVTHAPAGRRRTALYGAARGVARIVLVGALSFADGWEALFTAGLAAGQTDRDIRAAIVGGFRAEGLTTP